MNRSKRTNDELLGERLFRSKKFKRGYGDPYENLNGQSNRDGYDRSELSVRDQHSSPIDQDFVEDFEGDEDFYGDDEENQSGYSSYTGDQNRYLGQGNWADEQYGEHQFDHKGDVDYINQNRKEVHGISSVKPKIIHRLRRRFLDR